MSDFTLYALPVARGTLALAGMPGRNETYDDDLALLAQWKPSLVISLVTRVEMVEVEALDLGADIQARGTRWVHMPIRDMSVPTAQQDVDWPGVASRALAAINGGGRVLVHCAAGCGRSGMLVLRLMIGAGEKPDVALARLRALRSCAIETEAQMEWALRPSSDAMGAEFVRHRG